MAWYVDGTLIHTGSASFTYSFSEGIYTVKAIATDSANISTTDEVIISVNIPRNKFHGVHNFKGIIFIRKKGECMQSYDLDEYSEDYNFYYLKKKIPWDFIGSSIFKLKGIMHDFYFS